VISRRLSGKVTAVVMVTALGDVTSATRVAAAGGRRGAGFPADVLPVRAERRRRLPGRAWHLTGPVVCVSGTSAGLDLAALLIDDADADEALVVRADLAVAGGERGPCRRHSRDRPGRPGTTLTA